MRVLFIMAMLWLPLSAQNPQNVYAAGSSFNHAASPRVAGTALYARLLSPGNGTYAFTVLDALPSTRPPYTVTTSVSAGLSQRVFSIAGVPIYTPVSAGISYTGTNTGWAWTSGALASFNLPKPGWKILPMVRVVKSSVSNGTGYQLIAGVLVGWAQ